METGQKVSSLYWSLLLIMLRREGQCHLHLSEVLPRAFLSHSAFFVEAIPPFSSGSFHLNSTQSPGILSFFRLWGSRVEMVFRWESWEVQRDQKAYSASNIIQSFDKAVSSLDHGQFYGQFACFFTTKPGERVDLIISSCPQVWRFINGIFRFGF